jgi:hypothetical protein
MIRERGLAIFPEADQERTGAGVFPVALARGAEFVSSFRESINDSADAWEISAAASHLVQSLK